MTNALTAPLPGVRRIAILRALQLGDLLVAVPALRAIRAGYSDAEITLIGLPWAESFVARFAAYLDRFVEFPGWPGIAEVPYDAERTVRFVAEQRTYGYDLVVQLHGSGRTSNGFCLALGARVVAGSYDPALGSPPQEMALAAPYPDDRPEVHRNLGVAALLGCPADAVRATRLEFPLTDADRAEAATLLDALPAPGRGRGGVPISPSGASFASVPLPAPGRGRGGVPPSPTTTTPAPSPLPAPGRGRGGVRPLIGLHPGARPPARRWPVERFARLADRLIERLGATIVLTGGPGEEETARAVAEGMRAGEPLNLAGRTTLGGLAAVLAAFDLFIGNDTGPAHLAEAVGTPTARIFGPADPARWAPLDLARHRVVREPVFCSPCGHWECPIDHRCLRRIPAERVYEVAADLLGSLQGVEAESGANRQARPGDTRVAPTVAHHSESRGEQPAQAGFVAAGQSGATSVAGCPADGEEGAVAWSA